jgi:DNA-binding transcriptional regulator YiaG
MAAKAKKTAAPKSKPRARQVKYVVTPAPSKMEWNGETIRALREHLQLTQAQMAQELGTRQQTISEWEVGMYKPRGGMARLLTMVAERANFVYDTKGTTKDKA